MGKVLAICLSKQRNQPKRPVLEALFVEKAGIEGDSHFGFSKREVSLLLSEDVEKAELDAGIKFPPGSLAENLLIQGLSPDHLEVGSLISIGDVVLKVIEKGKSPDEPHSYDYKGWCLLPYCGYFLAVQKGGVISPGMEAEILPSI